MIEGDCLPGDADTVFAEQHQEMFSINKFHVQSVCHDGRFFAFPGKATQGN